MNQLLRDPFEADYPDRIEEELQHGNLQAKCVAFNRRGTLLATGCQDAITVLWDFDTRGVVKTLQQKDPNEPPSSVVAIGWSLDGRRLITSEDKGKVRIWDVESGTAIYTQKFESTCLTVQISPSNNDVFIACPNQHVPVIVNITNSEVKEFPGAHVPETAMGASRSKVAGEALRNYVACFERSGEQVYIGNGKGVVSVWNVATMAQVDSISLPSTTAVRNFQFTRDGSSFLVSETGKIRVYDSQEGTLHREFLDQVNRTQWRKCLFSAEGNYVLGATAEKGEHSIHIWNRDNGQLILRLEGPKESIWDLAWHPTRAIIASVAQSGKVVIWAKQYAENYSAFAPNFKELEENEEYIEREDEFDLIDQQEVVKKKQEEEEAAEVDITTVDELPSQFADLDNELVYLPAVPDCDPQLAVEDPDQLDPTPDADIKTRVYEDGVEVKVLHGKRVSAQIEQGSDEKRQKV